MLTLQHHLKLNKKAIDSPNLAEEFGSDDLKSIGDWVWFGYTQDKNSRYHWEKRSSAAMDLAMQVVKGKNFPWPNCANIAFPLVTIAALQFHARAYPAIISGTEVVQMRVIGEDPTGEKQSRANRVSTHMSYQVLEQDQAWEEQQDRLLINVPIVGVAFKKSYYSASKGHNVSELVLAQDLVMDYYAKSVESCVRKTHRIPLYRNDIYERVRRGTFCDVLEDSWYKSTPQQSNGTLQAQRDKREGLNPPQPDETTPFWGLEQHCSLDLDGDGYAEPYIITVEESSHRVLRIVTRFDQESDIDRTSDAKIIAITPMEYFTKFPFIPSPDGGIYDLGFGILLGPLNESVNTLINQLVDAGTMATTGGGFLARGMKIRGGVYTFAPLEWKRVDSTGEDLQKSIYPLPVREPSAVLFQLLSLLINYVNRVAGTTDPMVGESTGQNTTAEATRTMVEQGTKIFNGIFKRIWRSMKEEFRKLYILNGIYLPVRQVYGVDGAFALREDYLGDPNSIVPVADPNIISESAKVQQATLLKQAAATTPGYSRDEVERRWLRALRIDAPEAVFKGSEGQEPPKDPRIQVEELRLQAAQARQQGDMAMFAAELLEEQRLNNAKIIQLQAEATKMVADIQGDKEDRQINAVNSAIGVLKHHDEALRRRIELIMKGLEVGQNVGLTGSRQEQAGDGMGGMAGAPGNAVVPAGADPMAAAVAGAMG